MSSRVITVYSITPYMNAGGRYVEVPAIRLQGKWVEKLGFHTGSKIEIRENAEEITIKLVKEKEQQEGF